MHKRKIYGEKRSPYLLPIEVTNHLVGCPLTRTARVAEGTHMINLISSLAK